MLRDLPPFQPQPDADVFMNAPGAEDEPHGPSTTYVDPFDDVFGSAPASPALHAQGVGEETGNGTPSTSGAIARSSDHPSDVSRLRSIHVTNGYREGIAVSKEKHIQEGFDEGYSLGAEIALKAGYIIGALEGLYHALPNEAADATEEGDGSGTSVEAIRKDVGEMLEEAEGELRVENLFGPDYFGEDGVWVYDVPGQEDEGDVTFAKVAAAHPLIDTWSKKLQALCEKLGIALD